ncbi:hypothetical protein ABH916_003536 [Peribacillus frigoritolerans]
MNYFFSACFLLISKIIQLAISLARIYFFQKREPVSFMEPIHSKISLLWLNRY